MKPRIILHLTPYPTTSGDGISHYAARLGRELQNATGLASRFFYVRPGQPGGHDVGESRDVPVPLEPAGLSRAIAGECPDETVSGSLLIIHYFPFLYEAEVYPHQKHLLRWRSPLAEELRRLKRRYRLRVVLFVHEWLAKSLNTWKRVVLRPFERRSLRQLLAEADGLVCSNPVIEEFLQRIGVSKPVHVCPISSSCGEPPWARLHDKIPGSLLVFGADASLRRYLPGLLHDLPALRERLGVRQVQIAGGHGDVRVREFVPRIEAGGFAVQYTPSLPDPELSDALARSQFLYLDYFQGYPESDRRLLFKSSVWGMATAHACIPVLADQGIEAVIGTMGLPAFPHRRGRDWIVPDPEGLAALPRHLFDWYGATSSFQRVVAVLRSYLTDS